jgi:hypothetical protein
MGVCEVRTWVRKAEEYPLLEAVANQRLVKIQQVEKDLTDSAVICDLWRLAVAL